MVVVSEVLASRLWQFEIVVSLSLPCRIVWRAGGTPTPTETHIASLPSIASFPLPELLNTALTQKRLKDVLFGRWFRDLWSWLLVVVPEVFVAVILVTLVDELSSSKLLSSRVRFQPF